MSRQKIALLSLSIMATAALEEFTFVTLGGQTAAAGAAAHGVSAADAVAGELCAVDVIGTSTVLAEVAIAAGDALQVGAEGGAVPQTSGVLVGYAAEAAAEGEPFEVLIVMGATASAAPGGGA